MKSDVAARALKILHLEDSEVDHELMLAHLRRGQLDVRCTRIDSEPAFLASIQQDWDAIVSDYNLPGFSGLVALDLLKASGRDLPFIIVSGEIGEDTAVEAMRNGASDYLLKNNLARLVPALLHAIESAESRRARERAEGERDASKERLRALLQHLQTSIEHERHAIAREIHDDIGGSLTALKFDLAMIAKNAINPDVAMRAGSALETVSLAIEATQRIMHNLRPAILEQGLLAALQWMASRFEKRTGTLCALRLPAALPELPRGVPLAAYRTVQEALTNVTKHAQAKRVEIELSLAGGVLSLDVCDDGRGLSQEDLAKARSFGIRGLKERAATVGGWIELTSGPQGRGTTLMLCVPLVDDGESGDEGPTTEPDDPTGWGDL